MGRARRGEGRKAGTYHRIPPQGTGGQGGGLESGLAEGVNASTIAVPRGRLKRRQPRPHGASQWARWGVSKECDCLLWTVV